MNTLLIVSMLFLLVSFRECSILSSFANYTSKSRAKRAIYYLCGVYPRQYFSTRPCYYTEKKCENGGDMLGVGCTNQRQCALYHSGPTACINGCCCSVPSSATPPPNLTFGYCYNGQLSQVRCSAQGQCSPGQTCMNGLCCTATAQEHQYACGGVAALGTCRNGECSDGAYCNMANMCCECPVGRSGGQCNQGICPKGFTCMPNGYCCASCPNDATPFGACREGVCGGGTLCSAGNICC